MKITTHFVIISSIVILAITFAIQFGPNYESFALTSTSTSLTSSVNPSVFGQHVKFTAMVSPNTATGTVTFTIDGVAKPAVTISSGSANLTISTLSVGTHQIKAKYSGNSKFAKSTSSTLTQTVNSGGNGVTVSIKLTGDPCTTPCFNPANAQINAGGTVTWKNIDSIGHTATSSIFDSGVISPGNTFQHTFPSTGTTNYHCMIHPWMTGMVTVS